MGAIALFGCIVFVCWAYARDARDNPYPSGAILLPILWMMRCGSRSIDAWFGGSDLGRMDPVVIGTLLVLGIAVLFRRRCHWGRIFAHNSAIFLFYGYLIASVTWASSLDSPAIKVLRPAGDLIMALVIATERNPLAAMLTVFRRATILLIPLSVVLIKYFPDLGRGNDKHWGADPWIGVTTHKNPLGQLCIVCALAFLWSMLEARRSGRPLSRQPLAWIYLFLTLYLFNGGGNEGSRSATSILCLLIALGLFVGFGYMRGRIQMVMRRIVTSAVAVAVIALMCQFAGTSLQEVVANLAGKDATLSDRTYLWNDVIRLAFSNPVLGTGYGGFWVDSIYELLSPEVDNMPAQSHNGYLETFANLGLAGLGLLALVIFQSIRSATTTIQYDFDYGRVRLALLFMVLVMNYSEATFPRGTHLWWFGFLVVAVYAQPWVHGTQLAPAIAAPATSQSREPLSVTPA